MHDTDRKAEPVRFTVDGRTVTSPEEKITAAAILRLAGLDPAGYDLAKVRGGQADPKRFRDDEQVHIIKDSDAFVSIRQRAEVA